MVGRIWLIILNTPCTPAGAADQTAFGQPAPVPTTTTTTATTTNTTITTTTTDTT